YYYLYRHYKADIGRWLGRDSIEEKGGVNLYAFVGNETFGRSDRLGLALLGIISWVDPFDVVETYNSLDWTNQRSVSKGFVLVGLLGLAHSANNSRPEDILPSVNSFDIKDTRGALFYNVKVACKCVIEDGEKKLKASFNESKELSDPGYTPLPTGGHSQAEAHPDGDIIETYEWDGSGRMNITSYARLGAAGRIGGSLATWHGVPYISRKISVLVDCNKKQAKAVYYGSPFPSHQAYFSVFGVDMRLQSQPETLLFGSTGQQIEPTQFAETGWHDIDIFNASE
ncbi:hypothetical protein OAB00_01000, partial [Akkermansiaceae bacterium]|nr:hypothetical protein [Akkermansiaceae bacterium]